MCLSTGRCFCQLRFTGSYLELHGVIWSYLELPIIGGALEQGRGLSADSPIVVSLARPAPLRSLVSAFLPLSATPLAPTCVTFIHRPACVPSPQIPGGCSMPNGSAVAMSLVFEPTSESNGAPAEATVGKPDLGAAVADAVFVFYQAIIDQQESGVLAPAIKDAGASRIATIALLQLDHRHSYRIQPQDNWFR